MLTKSLTQRIQERAYEVFLRREREGRPGDPEQDWREAEKEIAAEDAKSKHAPAGVKQAAPAPVAPKVEPRAEIRPVPKVEPAKIEPKPAEVKKHVPAHDPAPSPVKKAAVVAKKASR